MKRISAFLSAAVVMAVVASVSTPGEAAAKEAASTCQFYRGEPLCKTIEETNCVGVSVGVEGQTCRRTTEFWYWS